MDVRFGTFGSSLNDRTRIAVIGDEDTITGFKLTGINGAGDAVYKSPMGKVNYMHAVRGSTTDMEIAEVFRAMLGRKEVAMILITQTIADRIREEINKKREAIPVVLEMPGKERRYNPENDDVLNRLREIVR